MERPLPPTSPSDDPPVSRAKNSAGGPVNWEQDECTEEAGEGSGSGWGLHELWRLLGCGLFIACCWWWWCLRWGEKSSDSGTEPGERCACSRNSLPLISLSREPAVGVAVVPWWNPFCWWWLCPPPNRLAMLGCALSMCSFHSPRLDSPRWQWGQVMEEEEELGNDSESPLSPFSGLCCDCCCC